MVTPLKVDTVIDEGYYACIDPGVSGTGVCVWHASGTGSERHRLISVACISPKLSAPDWMFRSNQVMNELTSEMLAYPIQAVWCEFPQHFGNDAVGSAAAARGDIIKLATFVGRIQQLCAICNIHLELVQPNVWKGQWTKEKVEARICTILPKELTSSFKSHVWDAIGISLWAQERW